MHSKFTLTPMHGIHFGSQLCGTVSVPSILSISNIGEFSFSFRLLTSNAPESSMEPSTERTKAMKVSNERENLIEERGIEAERKSTKGKKKYDSRLSAGNVTPETLDLKCFTLSPATGTLLPGTKQDISVYFKADKPGIISEKIKIAIPDTDPLLYPNDILYEVAGESCLPAISLIPEIIFEEHHIVDKVDPSDPFPLCCTYSKQDQTFFFGVVILGLETKNNLDENYSKAAENFVQARLRIQNPSKVSCSVQFSIICSPEQQTEHLTGVPSCMEVSPYQADIPPLDHTYATCSFRPTAMQRYSGRFEITISYGAELRTSLFTCDLKGEGTLPHLFVELPSLLSPSGIPWLKFPRLLVGRSFVLPIVLHNKGIIAAIARVQSGSNEVGWIKMTNLSGYVNSPLQFGDTFTVPCREKKMIMVTFSPTAKEFCSQEIKVVIDQNPFDNPIIQISAEGYSEDITFLGLPRNSDDEIWFEDCTVGTKRSAIFRIKNNDSDKHWRFVWPEFEHVEFSPSVGHLLGGATKEIYVTFNPNRAVEYVDQVINLQICNISYKDGEELDWDDRCAKPSGVDNRCAQEIVRSNGEDKISANNSSSKTEDKSIPATSQVVLLTDFSGKPRGETCTTQASCYIKQEPIHEVIEGSNKLIALKLHAVADNPRYDCNIQTVQFKPTMMFQTRIFTFLLKNISHACMQFSWKVCFQDGNPDNSGMYKVNPETGFLQAANCAEITLKFCPSEVEDCTRILACEIPNLDITFPPLQIPIAGQVSRPWCHFELPRSDYLTRCSPDLPHPDGKFSSLNQDIKVIEFDSVGCNVRNIKYFIARNATNVTYKFVWEPKEEILLHQSSYSPDAINNPELLPNPFKCLSKSGEISSGKKYEMGFEYTPRTFEIQERFWVFRIPKQDIEVLFLLVGNVKKPLLSLDRSNINFGKVLVGSCMRQAVQLTNPESVQFSFTFDKLSYSTTPTSKVSMKPQLQIQPMSGVVLPKSMLPIEVIFSPTIEGQINLNAICHVKKGCNLSLNIKGEGYVIHEDLYLVAAEDGAPLKLLPKGVNHIDFGQMMINERAFKKLVLTNHGNFPFHFLWDTRNHTMVQVEPIAGSLGMQEQITFDLSYCPTNLKSNIEIPLTCQILHGNKYTLMLCGSCYHPKVKFSFYEFDFGPCLLYHPGEEPASTQLTITNEGSMNITCESLYESTTILEVDHIKALLKPGQTVKMKLIFKPNHESFYKENLSFQINGLDTVTVSVRGEGTPVLLELLDSRQRNITFGPVRLGQTAERRVLLTNKSKIPVKITFQPSRQTLQQYGVTCLPEEGLTLASKNVSIFNVQFSPQARVAPFKEWLVVEAAGSKLILLCVSGACLGVDVKLSNTILPFNSVTLGSQITKKLQLENSGDLGTTFSWDTKACGTDFEILPTNGFLVPHQVATIDVTFHPTYVNPEICVEHIPCLVTGGETLFLTLTGGCSECDNIQDTLTFNVPVRSTETKTIQLKNGTATNWIIHPKISSDFWTGATRIFLPPNATVGYEITFKPLTMTVSEKDFHNGSILFPLPDGLAISYKLIGKAVPPLPEGNLSYKTKARTSLQVTLPLQNWLKATQHFVTLIEQDESTAPYATIRGPEQLDVAGFSIREIVFYIYSFKEGTINAKVVFKNDNSGEYLFFNLNVVVDKADIAQHLTFNCFVRQRITQTIHLINQLDKPVTFMSKCPNPEVSVAESVQLQPKSTVAVEVAFRPLVERDCICFLSLESELLGEYLYELRLKSITPKMEPPLSFVVSLGSQQVQIFRFTHFLPAKTVYTCEISQRLDSGFTVDSTLSAKPAGPDGVELQVPVVFEPSEVVDKFAASLTVKSDEGGEYRCLLIGTCNPPNPQGPFLIKGNGQISFKNVFPRPVQFFYTVDNPSFTVSKGEKIPSKKQSKLLVTYNSLPGTSSTGRLIVSCAETIYTWVFYLQGL